MVSLALEKEKKTWGKFPATKAKRVRVGKIDFRSKDYCKPNLFNLTNGIVINEVNATVDETTDHSEVGKNFPLYLISNDDKEDILDEENVNYIELGEQIPSTRHEEENIVDEENVNYI